MLEDLGLPGLSAFPAPLVSSKLGYPASLRTPGLAILGKPVRRTAIQ
jgi:hypothetical protein